MAGTEPRILTISKSLLERNYRGIDIKTGVYKLGDILQRIPFGDTRVNYPEKIYSKTFHIQQIYERILKHQEGVDIKIMFEGYCRDFPMSRNHFDKHIRWLVDEGLIKRSFEYRGKYGIRSTLFPITEIKI